TRTLTELSPVDLIAKLGLLVVLPMVLAQLLRQSHLIASWADVRGKSLSTAAQCGILFMVLIGSVGCGMELAKRAVGDELRQVDFIAMLVVVLVVHVTMFGVGFAMAGMFRMSRPDRIAVGFAGSQKTLAVGVYIASFLPGMALLPIVSYHVIQLVVDTVIAERLAAQVPGEAHETEVRRAAH
ncbi:MAG: bile acid:sodium symporter, partial [Planctomycetales bacterium]|nr:bile acid:sodium symporter [Planctomycetales bacterium]